MKPGSFEWHQRVERLTNEVRALRADPATPRHTFWLSYANNDRFLGVIIIDDCVNFMDALMQCKAMGVNPGGEVQGVQLAVPDIPAARDLLARTPRLTLLSKADLIALGHELSTDWSAPDDSTHR